MNDDFDDATEVTLYTARTRVLRPPARLRNARMRNTVIVGCMVWTSFLLGCMVWCYDANFVAWLAIGAVLVIASPLYWQVMPRVKRLLRAWICGDR